MAVSLLNFPLQSIVDGLISYLQFIFQNDEVVPASYRWDVNDRTSKIRISAPFVIDNEKPMSAPFIVVERGSFKFQNLTIDNVKSATPNTFENVRKDDVMDGYVNVICGSGTASEASNIANFLAINFQADRHGIAGNMPFVRNLRYDTVGPEIPVVKDTEVRRWEVTLSLFVSMQIGWINIHRQPIEWNKVNLYGINTESETFSDKGIVSVGSDILTDPTKSFGYLEANDPQLLEKELAEGYYYIQFTGSSQLYPVSEIVSNNELKLLSHDADHNPVPYSAPLSLTDVEYKLWWNCVHIRGEIPNNNS